MIGWDEIVKIAMRFPGVEESTSYGNPALRVSGEFMCRMRTNPDGFVIKVLDLEDKAALLKQDPDVFFTTRHYEGYAFVVVRLDKVGRQTLEELIEDAWRIRAPKRLVKEYDG